MTGKENPRKENKERDSYNKHKERQELYFLSQCVNPTERNQMINYRTRGREEKYLYR